MSNAGKSARFMTMKLMQNGIEDELIDEVLNTSESDDLSRARLLVKRKKLGPFRPDEIRAEYYKKDLATLGRAGFSYETSRRALNADDDF